MDRKYDEDIQIEKLRDSKSFLLWQFEFNIYIHEGIKVK